MTRAEMQSRLRETEVGEGAIVVAFSDEGGYGVVAYVRNSDYDPYIVHRWATVDTAGEPVRNGFMLWNGVYTGDPHKMIADFELRSRTSWPQAPRLAVHS